MELQWRTGWGSDHPVMRDGVEVARTRGAVFSSKVAVTIEGALWTYRPRFSTLSAECEDGRSFTAQSAMLSDRWTVTCNDLPYEIKTKMFSNASTVVLGDLEVAQADRRGLFQPTWTLTAHPDMPLEHALFVLWVIITAHDRRNTKSSN